MKTLGQWARLVVSHIHHPQGAGVTEGEAAPDADNGGEASGALTPAREGAGGEVKTSKTSGRNSCGEIPVISETRMT